jgi:hypothetical protein
VANLGIAEIEKSAAMIGAYLSKDQMTQFLAEVAEGEQERQFRSKKR